jgi:hypothetical protein
VGSSGGSSVTTAGRAIDGGLPGAGLRKSISKGSNFWWISHTQVFQSKNALLKDTLALLTGDSGISFIFTRFGCLGSTKIKVSLGKDSRE